MILSTDPLLDVHKWVMMCYLLNSTQLRKAITLWVPAEFLAKEVERMKGMACWAPHLAHWLHQDQWCGPHQSIAQLTDSMAVLHKSVLADIVIGRISHIFGRTLVSFPAFVDLASFAHHAGNLQKPHVGSLQLFTRV